MERDAEVIKLRAETARIYRHMQLDRDARLADTLETGEQNAEQDLSAMSTAFSLQSGDEWIPPQAAARRATLIGALTVSRTVRLNSAAPTSVEELPERSHVGDLRRLAVCAVDLVASGDARSWNHARDRDG